MNPQTEPSPILRLPPWVAAALLLLQVMPSLLHAQTLTWDANSGTAGIQNGNGTWENGGSGSNWVDGASANVTFTNGDSVIIGDSTSPASGTITVSGTVETPSLPLG